MSHDRLRSRLRLLELPAPDRHFWNGRDGRVRFVIKGISSLLVGRRVAALAIAALILSGCGAAARSASPPQTTPNALRPDKG